MNCFFVSYYFIYLIAQSVSHWWGIFFTQQISCLPYVLLITTSWYIGIYTVDTLLYSLYFTNCIIPFLPLLSIHPQVFTWVLQPEILSETCGAGAEWPGMERSYSGMKGIWQQKWGNNLGLSSCAVPRSTVARVVAYFRRTELLPGVSERSGIDW